MYSIGLLSHFSCVRLFVTPWTVAHQALLSMGILQASILDWAAISFLRGSFPPRDRTLVSCIAGGFFTTSAPWEAHFSVGCFLIVMLECWSFLCRCYLVEVNFFKCVIFPLRDLMSSKNYQTVIVLQKDSINYFMECCYLLLS